MRYVVEQLVDGRPVVEDTVFIRCHYKYAMNHLGNCGEKAVYRVDLPPTIDSGRRRFFYFCDEHWIDARGNVGQGCHVLRHDRGFLGRTDGGSNLAQ